MRATVIGVILALSSIAYAEYNTIGWNWYQTPRPQHQHVSRQVEQQARINQPLSAREKLQRFQNYYKEVRARAVINPTPRNVAHAMQLHKFMYDRAQAFGKASKEAVLMYPSLSQQLNFPTQDVAQQIYSKQNTQKQHKAVQQIADQYGLFFFYKGQNPYAQRMGPIVQRFADKHNLKLIGVTMDGTALPQIEDNRPNRGQARAVGVKALPAVFLVDPDQQQARPIAYGFTTQNELLNRIHEAVTDYGRKEVP